MESSDIMKTLIDIPDRQINSLSELCDKFSISSARKLITVYPLCESATCQ